MEFQGSLRPFRKFLVSGTERLHFWANFAALSSCWRTGVVYPGGDSWGLGSAVVAVGGNPSPKV